MKKSQAAICYLCGRTLSPPINVDHPVMQQLFAPEIRRKHNISKLITFDVHTACNTAYQHDEDYFVRSLMPFARVPDVADCNGDILQQNREPSRAPTICPPPHPVGLAWPPPQKLAQLAQI